MNIQSLGSPKYEHFAKSVHHYVPKNVTLDTQTQILLSLLEVQHPPKMMELPLILMVYHF